MKKFRAFSTLLVLLVAMPFYTSAQTMATQLPNLDILKDQITTYYTSGAYLADASAVVAQAQAYVDERVREGVTKPAIVLDIDDTMLSGFDYERSHDYGYDSKSYDAVADAEAFPAILPTLTFVQHAAAEHVAIFYVTGRRTDERAVTLGNLSKVGYPAPVALYLRPLDDKQTSVIPFKSHARAAIAAQGYDILLSIGDQYSDLLGGYCERTFKLPNPMYFIP